MARTPLTPVIKIDEIILTMTKEMLKKDSKHTGLKPNNV